MQAKVLTDDEARRVAANIARLRQFDRASGGQGDRRRNRGCGMDEAHP
jgi:hypothetical protein